MITELISPFGAPFDLSVLLGVLLTTAAILLARRHRDDGDACAMEPRPSRTPTNTRGQS